MSDKGTGPETVGPRSPSALSLLLTAAVYVVTPWLLMDPDICRSLAFLLPPDWWREVAGKVGILVFLWLIITWRLRCESRTWDALGWRGLPVESLGRELPWALACAGLVIVLGELFLNNGPVPSNQDAVERLGPIIDSPGAGKYALLALGTVLTGIKEELFYRGSFFAFLRGEGRRGLAVFVVMSSVVFAAFHGLSTFGDYVVYAVMGAVFAVTLAASGSLRAVMLAHILVNGFHTGLAVLHASR